jgi:DNA-binding Lrp family transcriptional regulator
MKQNDQTVSLDELDWKILRELQHNAKQTYSEIGRTLGVAHSTVYDRIRKMENNGVILGWTIDVDHDKLGVSYVTAEMTVYTDPKETEKVADALSAASEVLDVSMSLSEDRLIHAKIVANNQEEQHTFIAKKVAPLRGVLRIRTSIITKKITHERFVVSENENYKR